MKRDRLKRETQWTWNRHFERSETVNENTRGHEIRDMNAWLSLFCKHVGDKVPIENMTVVPYRQIKTIWEEYFDDITGAGGSYIHCRHFTLSCCLEQMERET
jgi:hypothetical protein